MEFGFAEALPESALEAAHDKLKQHSAAVMAEEMHHAASRIQAGFDEGLLSLTLSNPLCMENPYKYSKCQ